MGARLCPEGVCLAWCVKCLSRKFLVLRKYSVMILTFTLTALRAGEIGKAHSSVCLRALWGKALEGYLLCLREELHRQA